jgi:hypothetical protein
MHLVGVGFEGHPPFGIEEVYNETDLDLFLLVLLSRYVWYWSDSRTCLYCCQGTFGTGLTQVKVRLVLV